MSSPWNQDPGVWKFNETTTQTLIKERKLIIEANEYYHAVQ